MQEEGHVVALDLQIALISVRGKRKSIELRGVQLGLRGIVDNLAVLAVTGPENLAQRLSVSIIRHGVIKFAAHHEVNVFAGVQRFVGLDMAVRPDKGHLEGGIAFLDFAQKLDVAGKPDGGSKQDEEFVILADFDSLPPVNAMRRGIHQPATRN